MPMSRRAPLLLGIAALLLFLAGGCSDPLPVQPTPDRIEDYFDAVEDEPDPITKYIDDGCLFIPIDIFVDQVYYSYDPIREAFPKSLITRGTDGSITNGEIGEVYLSCVSDVAVFYILTDASSYQYGDFYGIVNLDPADAQEIRDALLDFTPKRR
jgi:hypothetical protein